MMSIGESIRNLRRKAGFTQKQLAEKVGVNEVTIRSYEAEKYNPKMNTLAKLCVALDCKITDLIDEDSQKYYRMFDYTEEDEKRLKEEAARKAPKFTAYDENGNEIKDGKPPKFTDSSMSKEEAIAEAEAEELERLQTAYKRLNRKGKTKAVERVEELTEIPRYIKEDPPIDPFFMLSKKKRQR